MMLDDADSQYKNENFEKQIMKELEQLIFTRMMGIHYFKENLKNSNDN